MSKEVDNLREERELFILRNLLKDLANEDWQVRIRAISGLTQVKKTTEFYQEALDQIILATLDGNQTVREAAIPFLGDLPGGGEKVVNRLIEILDSPSLSEVKAAVYSLGKIGPDSLQSISKLITLANNSKEDLFKAISWSLSMLGPNSLPVLLTNVNNNIQSVRIAVISALGNMGPLAECSLEKLISCLKDSSPSIRIESAKAIGNLRAVTTIAKCIEPLRDLLNDPDPDVRWTSAEALRKIGTDDAISAWSEYKEVGTSESYFKQLGNPDKSVRLHAAESLFSVLNEDSTLEVEIIKKSLSDTYYKVIVEICNSLTKVGEKAKIFKNELTSLLDHTDFPVIISALQLFGKSNCNEKEVIEKIVSMLSHQDKEVRLAAGLALEFLDTSEARQALKKFKWE